MCIIHINSFLIPFVRFLVLFPFAKDISFAKIYLSYFLLPFTVFFIYILDFPWIFND